MDIDEFYDADARRRPSAELEFGTEWTDAQGLRYEFNYIEDTGELYAMQEPPPKEAWEDPFGGLYLKDMSDKGLQVRVVAQIPSVDLLHQILEGWQTAMGEAKSVEWLAERLRVAGVAEPTS